MTTRLELLNQFKELNPFVQDIADLDWTTPISEGKWTIHDVVSHIVLWDKYFYESTIEPIANDKEITLERIDFDEFNNNAVTYGKTKTKDELIELTMQYRNLLIDCIGSLDEAKYTKKYVHDVFSFKTYLEDFISHDRHHMAQINELKGKLAK